MIGGGGTMFDLVGVPNGGGTVLITPLLPVGLVATLVEGSGLLIRPEIEESGLTGVFPGLVPSPVTVMLSTE